MTELVRFETGRDGHVVVEVDEDEPGVRRVGRVDGLVEVSKRFKDVLGGVRDAAADALEVFRDERLRPDQIEIEIGVRLNAEVGAVIAKTASEGHLVVKLTWEAETGQPKADPKADPAHAPKGLKR
ncbi:CU044_2847 family protein [Planotetraspora sp. GP83]|uniref:CU044_2847 family protein n=1 Tax=Planotetraspora sp. GP83 TaxID=3156264 RepID=UPI0035199CB0